MIVWGFVHSSDTQHCAVPPPLGGGFESPVASLAKTDCQSRSLGTQTTHLDPQNPRGGWGRGPLGQFPPFPLCLSEAHFPPPFKPMQFHPNHISDKNEHYHSTQYPMGDPMSLLMSSGDHGKWVLEDAPICCRVMVIFPALQRVLDSEILVG